MTRKILLIVSFLNYIGFAVPMIYIEYNLSKGFHILPDMELGYTININQIELYLAIIMILTQLILLAILFKAGEDDRRRTPQQ